jgi:hypothetical protein
LLCACTRVGCAFVEARRKHATKRFVAVTHEEVDRFAGQRVRVARNDGSVFVGVLDLDSVTYVVMHGDDITRSLRYDDIRSVEAADSTTPDTN